MYTESTYDKVVRTGFSRNSEIFCTFIACTSLFNHRSVAGASKCQSIPFRQIMNSEKKRQKKPKKNFPVSDRCSLSQSPAVTTILHNVLPSTTRIATRKMYIVCSAIQWALCQTLAIFAIFFSLIEHAHILNLIFLIKHTFFSKFYFHRFLLKSYGVL